MTTNAPHRHNYCNKILRNRKRFVTRTPSVIIILYVTDGCWLHHCCERGWAADAVVPVTSKLVLILLTSGWKTESTHLVLFNVSTGAQTQDLKILSHPPSAKKNKLLLCCPYVPPFFDILYFLSRSKKKKQKKQPSHSSPRASLLEAVRWWGVFSSPLSNLLINYFIFVEEVVNPDQKLFCGPNGSRARAN